jgi:lipopolysaccharide transport system permease protein
MPFVIKILRTTFNHRQLSIDLIKRDLKLRYLGSILGRYWNILHPLAMILIYTVIFSQVMGAKIGGLARDNPYGYTIYLCAALLPWNAFTELVNRTTTVFLDNSHFIKKVSFPHEIIHSIPFGTSLISYVIALFFYLIMLFGIGYPMNWQALALVPIIFLLQSAFAIGLGFYFSVFQVFFRDTQQIVGIVFQIWFWGTPIVYMIENISAKLQFIFYLNPFWYFANMYHDIFVGQSLPDLRDLLVATGLAAFFFVSGAEFLKRFMNDIPDEI